MDAELGRIHYQSGRVADKVIAALATIAQALKRSSAPYVAFSGGKDSLATLALVHMVNPDVPLVWSDDEMEYPETVAYMEQMSAVAGPQFVMYTSFATHANWFTSWSDPPYWREPLPGTLPFDVSQEYDLVFLGLRMEENRRRRDWLIQAGPTYGGSTTQRRCNPMWDWTADDVWALIAQQGLPYNAVYDRLEEMSIPRKRQRVGPLPLVPRDWLAEGWPDLLTDLETRYGRHWT